MHLVTTILVPILLVIIQLRVWPGARKVPQAGAHRKISRFPGSRFPGSRFPGRQSAPDAESAALNTTCYVGCYRPTK